jgi:hypothetical protein
MRAVRRADVAWSAGIAAATVALGAAVALHRVEFGSTAGHWVFKYLGELEIDVVAVALAAGVAIAVAHAVARRLVPDWPWLVVPAALVAGVGAQLALHGLSPYGLRELLVSDVATGFHGAAARSGPLELLTDFDRVVGRLPMHARVNMPGKVLLFHGLSALTPDPALQAVAIVVLSSLAGVFLYAVVARTFGDRRIGLDAMVLWLLVPSKIAFHPLPNVVSPLPAMIAVWCMARYLDSCGLLWAAAAGAAAYATTLFDPLALWIGVAFTPLLADAVARRGVPVRAIVLLLGVALGALVACHAAMVLATGFDVAARLVRMADIVREFNVTWSRSRDVWLVANLKDVVLAVGPAVAAAWVAAGLAAARSIGRGDWTPGPALALASLAVLAALDAICLNRGEVARLWIFAFLPAQAAVAWWAAGRPFARSATLACTVAWAAITIATVGYCVP